MLSAISGQTPFSNPHACLKSYTPWLVRWQIWKICLVYVQYMFRYILQYVRWRVLQSRNHQAKLMDFSLNVELLLYATKLPNKQQTYTGGKYLSEEDITQLELWVKSSKSPPIMQKCCCRSVKQHTKKSAWAFFPHVTKSWFLSAVSHDCWMILSRSQQ